jgi:hypothetical protein
MILFEYIIQFSVLLNVGIWLYDLLRNITNNILFTLIIISVINTSVFNIFIIKFNINIILNIF